MLLWSCFLAGLAQRSPMWGWRTSPRFRASRACTSSEPSPMLLGWSDDPERWPGSWGGIEQNLGRRPGTDDAWVFLDAGVASRLPMPGWRTWPRSRASRACTYRESWRMLLGRSVDPEGWPGSWGGIEQNLAGRPGTDAARVLVPCRRCQRVTDAGLEHLAKIQGLQSLELM